MFWNCWESILGHMSRLKGSCALRYELLTYVPTHLIRQLRALQHGEVRKGQHWQRRVQVTYSRRDSFMLGRFSVPRLNDFRDPSL